MVPFIYKEVVALVGVFFPNVRDMRRTLASVDNKQLGESQT